MLLITCPVTGIRTLASLDSIRSIVNHADGIAVHVTCPECGGEHVRRTGRRRREGHRSAALEVAVRRAETPIPA